MSILAAYIFYFVVDVLPRAKKETSINLILNSLLASILDSYARCRIYGHETSLPYVDKECLSPKWMEENIQETPMSN